MSAGLHAAVSTTAPAHLFVSITHQSTKFMFSKELYLNMTNIFYQILLVKSLALKQISSNPVSSRLHKFCKCISYQLMLTKLKNKHLYQFFFKNRVI